MLYDALKRLTKHSLVYALGPAAHKAVGFLLIPLITSYIGTTANYGVVELAGIALVIAGQLLGLNVLSGLTRFYFKYEGRERDELVMTTLVMLVGGTGSALAIALLFDEPLAELVFGSAEYAEAIRAVGLILVAQTVGLVGLRTLQILQRSLSYGLLTTAKLLVEIAFKIWFMVGLGLTYMGVLYSVLAGEALLALGTLAFLLRRAGLAFSLEKAARLLRFSYPLILSGLCMFALHQIDRFVIRAVHGLDETGLYALGYKFGSVVNLVLLEAFGLIWFPFVFSLRDEEEVRLVCRKVLTYFGLLMIFGSLVVAIFAPEIVHLMAERRFWGVERYVPPILLGYVFWALYQVVHTSFYLKERTGLLSLQVVLGAGVNLLLNLVLVPPLGALGAAFATALTFLLLAFSAWRMSERLFPVGYELGRVLGPLGLAILLWLGSTLLPADSAFVTWVVKSGLVLAFPLVLLGLGFLDERERARLAAILLPLRERLGR